MLTFPNAENPPNFPAQAVPDATDLAAIVAAGQQTGVVSGCQVSALGTPGWGVQVASGVIVSVTVGQMVASVASIAIAPAGVTDRKDIVAVTASGVVYVTQGTASAVANWGVTSGPNPPVKPSLTSPTDVLLAEVHIPAGATAILPTMITDKTAIITPPLTSAQVPGTVYLPGSSPTNKKRTVFSLGCGNSATGGTTNAATDYNNRIPFTLPATPIRCRLRIRNSNTWGSPGGFSTSPVQVIAAYWGTPTQSLATWDGSFAATPTLVDSGMGGAVDIGTSEYVGPWFTPPVSAKAHQIQCLSVGYLAPSGGVNYGGAAAGYTFTGTGSWAAAGNAGVPGTTRSVFDVMDIRLEYEFVGSNQLALFLGTSLTAGTLNGLPVALGPDCAWPNKFGLRSGHCVMNGGEPQATVQYMFYTAADFIFTRFYDASWVSGAPIWPGGCVPDYCAIHLPYNDTGMTWSALQARMISIVALVKSLGIPKVIMCTEMVSGNPVGQLATGISAGALPTITIAGYPNTPDSRPGGGYPGAAANWTMVGKVWIEYPDSDQMDGPFTVASMNASNGVMTLTGATAAHAHLQGATVMGYNEGIRQLYNQWVMQGIFGTSGCVDIGTVGERGSVPAFTYSPLYYTPNGGGHPSSPALYTAMAERFAASFAGV